MKDHTLLDELLELSISERILLAESLWESIVVHSEEVPITEEQKAELDRRLAGLEQGDIETESWEAVKRRLQNR